MRASAPYLFADAMVVVYLQIDTLVISLIATEQEVGWYATADTIFGSLLFVPAVLLTAIFPRMARVHHERPEEMAGHVQQAFTEYAKDVRAGVFPGPEHCYQIDAADEASIRAARRRDTAAPAVAAAP